MNVEAVWLDKIYFFDCEFELILLTSVENWVHVKLLLSDFSGIKSTFLGTLEEKK